MMVAQPAETLGPWLLLVSPVVPDSIPGAPEPTKLQAKADGCCWLPLLG